MLLKRSQRTGVDLSFARPWAKQHFKTEASDSLTWPRSVTIWHMSGRQTNISITAAAGRLHHLQGGLELEHSRDKSEADLSTLGSRILWKGRRGSMPLAGVPHVIVGVFGKRLRGIHGCILAAASQCGHRAWVKSGHPHFIPCVHCAVWFPLVSLCQVSALPSLKHSNRSHS